MERIRVRSGSPFEDSIGFSRAVRVGSRCLVSGTAPIWPDGSCRNDVKAQTLRCFEIIGAALSEVGASLKDIVRTRMYLVDPSDANAVGHAHAEALGDTCPAATMVVVAGLLDSRWRVEIEAEAEVAD
jgi:enamine deaminase RidA (YjgF/YER057c/UK114 family)